MTKLDARGRIARVSPPRVSLQEMLVPSMLTDWRGCGVFITFLWLWSIFRIANSAKNGDKAFAISTSYGFHGSPTICTIRLKMLGQVDRLDIPIVRGTVPAHSSVSRAV